MSRRFAMPFAVVATLVAGCSSSSSSAPSDGGTKDTGPMTEAGPRKEAGSKDAGSGPTPAPGSTRIVKGLTQIIGLTDDDDLAFFDSTGGISVSDIHGNVTQIKPGVVLDGGSDPPTFTTGRFVYTFAKYTAQGGTLSFWSRALGSFKQVATDSTVILGIAADSSSIVYTDGADPTGTYGNIGVMAADGTATDLLKNVVIDYSSSSCDPFAFFDEAYVIISSCAAGDGGVAAPTINSFDGSNSWANTLLASNAGPSGSNVATDTGGINVLTVSGATPNALSIQGIGSTAQAAIASNVGAPAGGSLFFYLSQASTFALFTQPSGALGKATFAAPTSPVPVVSQLAPPADGGAGGVFGVLAVSPDDQYEVDYDTAVSATGFPNSLNLRNLASGTVTPLSPRGTPASVFFGPNYLPNFDFTTDGSYVLFSTGQVPFGSSGSYLGTLKATKVDGTVAHTLVSKKSVYTMNPLAGTKLLYDENIIPSAFTKLPNGAASADIYVADATLASPGTLLVAGADIQGACANCGSTNQSYIFYVTKDKSHLFYSFSQVTVGDGGAAVVAPTDGVYCVAIP